MAEVSVIMPVYNKAEYLADGLQSVLAQTFRDFELLIINDGSTDDSLSVIKAFAQKDPRIVVFDVPNGGVSNARNWGLDHASGRYITFVDGDDCIHPMYLENLLNCISRSGADLVISAYEKFWDDSERRSVCTHPQEPGLYALHDLMLDFASVQKSTGIYGYCWGKLLRADLLTGVRFDPRIALAEDFDLYIRIYSKNPKIYIDNKPLYYYRQGTANSSMLQSDHCIDYLAQFAISIRYRSFLMSMESYAGKNKEVMDDTISSYLFLSLYYCPKKQMRKRFGILWQTSCNEQLTFRGKKLREKIVLGLFQTHLYWLLFTYVNSFHAIRKIYWALRGA